jgi:osmoprotectant transport system ATP-binding protein
VEIIEFKNITKSFQGKLVLDDISLGMVRGEFYTLIGSSGAGKTTFLRLINGLIKPDSGQVLINGEDIAKTDIIELRRNIGYVIQSIGLFPHMSIFDNINYVLSLKARDKSIDSKRVSDLINLVGMTEKDLIKYPSQLSGGQKQRIGVARALAADPEIILMDEPFGAVDDITRHMLQDEILEIQHKLNKTIVFVTHDIEEAIKLGTKIIILNEGKIEQIGTKNEITFFPKNEFVKSFLGNKSYIAYLTTTLIEDVCLANVENTNTLPFISGDTPVIEGVRRILSAESEAFSVIGQNGEIIGKFDLDFDVRVKQGTECS